MPECNCGCPLTEPEEIAEGLCMGCQQEEGDALCLCEHPREDHCMDPDAGHTDTGTQDEPGRCHRCECEEYAPDVDAETMEEITDPDRFDVRACGCYVNEDSALVYCPTHAHAEAMVASLRAVANAVDRGEITLSRKAGSETIIALRALLARIPS